MLRLNIIEREAHCRACDKHGILLDEDTKKLLLNEVSRKDLLSDMEVRRRGRADQYKAVYQGYNPMTHTVYFTADGNKNTKWNQVIKLEDMSWLMKDESIELSEKLRLALAGEVKVYCNCPDFLFAGYKYMGTELDYNAGSPESRFPEVRNPKLKGSMCKHLYRVLNQMPLHYSTILKKLKDREK